MRGRSPVKPIGIPTLPSSKDKKPVRKVWILLFFAEIINISFKVYSWFRQFLQLKLGVLVNLFKGRTFLRRRKWGMKFQVKELSSYHKLWFSYPHTFVTQFCRSLIFQTMHSVRSINLSLKYQRKFVDIKFVGKSKFLFSGLRIQQSSFLNPSSYDICNQY